jgi:hypothetical protein
MYVLSAVSEHGTADNSSLPLTIFLHDFGNNIILNKHAKKFGSENK